MPIDGDGDGDGDGRDDACDPSTVHLDSNGTGYRITIDMSGSLTETLVENVVVSSHLVEPNGSYTDVTNGKDGSVTTEYHSSGGYLELYTVYADGSIYYQKAIGDVEVQIYWVSSDGYWADFELQPDGSVIGEGANADGSTFTYLQNADGSGHRITTYPDESLITETW